MDIMEWKVKGLLETEQLYHQFKSRISTTVAKMLIGDFEQSSSHQNPVMNRKAWKQLTAVCVVYENRENGSMI